MKTALITGITGQDGSFRTELRDGMRLAYDDFLHNPMRAER